jgi:RimJ/RimL family protein N-acetyltransferase
VTDRRPSIRLRRATDADADLLLAWSNDPATRAASFHTAPIERGDHLSWLANKLASPATAMWIGEADGEAVGQVRIDVVAEGTGELSIAVAPQARGRGVGRALLDAAIATAGSVLPVEMILARVRLDNPASLALFASAGFSERSRGSCFGTPCAEFERRIA